MNKTLKLVLTAQAQHGDEKALNVLYKFVDEMLLAGKFKECDKVLKALNVTQVDPVITVGFLTLTLTWKSILLQRTRMYEEAQVHFEAVFGQSRAQSILKGLEP